MCMVFSYFRYHECNLIETLMNYRLHLGKDTIYKKKKMILINQQQVVNK